MESIALTDHEIDILTLSSEVIFQDFNIFANKMYGHFFRSDTSIRHLFGEDFHGFPKPEACEQEKLTPMARAMTHALVQLVKTVGSLTRDDADIQRLSAKHVSRGVTKDLYPILKESLLYAIRDTLVATGNQDKVEVPPTAYEQTLYVWSKAYDELSAILIETENDIRNKAAARQNGWEGFRKFRISTKTEVTVIHEELVFSDDDDDEDDGEDVSTELQTVMTLEPVDGGFVPSFDDGQHVCIRFFLPDYGTSHKNYALDASSTTKSFAIRLRPCSDRSSSTKHMIQGLKVGDEILISPPLGTFLVMESLIE